MNMAQETLGSLPREDLSLSSTTDCAILDEFHWVLCISFLIHDMGVTATSRVFGEGSTSKQASRAQRHAWASQVLSILSHLLPLLTASPTISKVDLCSRAALRCVLASRAETVFQKNECSLPCYINCEVGQVCLQHHITSSSCCSAAFLKPAHHVLSTFHAHLQPQSQTSGPLPV